MPTLSRADLSLAASAARAASNLITGWGGKDDAAKVASFLAEVDEKPALYAAFRDEFRGGKDAWHPALLRARLEEGFETPAQAQELLGSGTPLGTRLAQLSQRAAPDVDPDKLGTTLKGFVTGWFASAELQLLIQQLPAALDDAFAFAATHKAAGSALRDDDTPAALRARVKQSVSYELEEGGRDAAQNKLLKMLAARL